MWNILLNLNNIFKTEISSVFACFETREQFKKIIITDHYMITSQNNFIMLIILRWSPRFPPPGVHGPNNPLPLSVGGSSEYNGILQSVDFELIKRDIILGGPDLIRWVLLKPVTHQKGLSCWPWRCSLDEFHSYKVISSAKSHVCLEKDPKPQMTPLPADTLTAALWDPEQRTQLTHTWTPDPQKLR